VKGYRPNYEFHGVAVTATGAAATSTAGVSSPATDLDPSDPVSPSKSVH
jgi:hypothetical protein